MHWWPRETRLRYARSYHERESEDMNYRFTILTGAQAGRSTECSGPVTVLGRAPDCQVILDPVHDLVVSHHHGRVTVQGSEVHFQDISSNGSFINGQRISQVVLQQGTVIQLGPGGPLLRFDRDPSPAAQPSAAGVSGASGSPPRVVPPSSASPPRLVIEHLTHFDGARQTFELPVVRLGRDPLSDVAFHPDRDMMVSANHCKIMFSEGRLLLLDNDSTNGTFISQRRVTRAEIHGGEELMLGAGGPRMRLHVTRSVGQTGAAPTVMGDSSLVQEAVNRLHHSSQVLAEFPLPAGQQLLLGRGEDCQIRLPSMHVSLHHAALDSHERLDSPRPGLEQRHLRQRYPHHGGAPSQPRHGNPHRSLRPAPDRRHDPGPRHPKSHLGRRLPPRPRRGPGPVPAAHPRRHHLNIDAGQLRGPPRSFWSGQVDPAQGAQRRSACQRPARCSSTTSTSTRTSRPSSTRWATSRRTTSSTLSSRCAAPCTTPPCSGCRGRSAANAQRRRIDEVMSILELSDRAEHDDLHALGRPAQAREHRRRAAHRAQPPLSSTSPPAACSPDLEEKMMHLLRELALARQDRGLRHAHAGQRPPVRPHRHPDARASSSSAAPSHSSATTSECTAPRTPTRSSRSTTPTTWKERFNASPIYKEHVLDHLQYGDGMPPDGRRPRRRSTSPDARRRAAVLHPHPPLPRAHPPRLRRTPPILHGPGAAHRPLHRARGDRRPGRGGARPPPST